MQTNFTLAQLADPDMKAMAEEEAEELRKSWLEWYDSGHRQMPWRNEASAEAWWRWCAAGADPRARPPASRVLGHGGATPSPGSQPHR
jgi:hypothetical protein